MGEGTFEMRVSDNGQGFDLKSKKGHYGQAQRAILIKKSNRTLINF